MKPQLGYCLPYSNCQLNHPIQKLVNINTYLKKPHDDKTFKNIDASFIDGTYDQIDEINDGDHEKHNLINKYPNYFQSAQYMLTKEKDVPNTMEPFNKASYSATQNYLPIRKELKTSKILILFSIIFFQSVN